MRALVLLWVAVFPALAAADGVTYQYDEAGRLRRSTYDDGTESTYQIDAAGNRTNVQATVPSPAVRFSVPTGGYSVSEGSPKITISVRRLGNPAGTASVAYTTASAGTGAGFATVGSDYTTTTGTLSWTAGQGGTKTFDIPILEDTTYEGDETFSITLSSPVGLPLGTPSTTTVRIVENDPPPTGTLQLTASTYSVAENGGTLSISVSRINGSAGAATVHFATTAGTAVSPGDFTATSGTLSWAAGEAGNKSFPITLNDDTVWEGDQAFTVALDTATGATLGTPSSAPVTIVENEPPPGVLRFVTPSPIWENAVAGLGYVFVERVNGTAGTVSVGYASAPGTASTPQDYSSAPGTLTWANGESGQKSIPIGVIDDAIFEPAFETLTLTLSSPTGGATISGTNPVTVSIQDNDPAPPSGDLRFASSTYSVNENTATLSVVVQRVSGSFGAGTVRYTATSGSATLGGDFNLAQGTLSFADGETSKTISVAILDDSSYEGNETFTITLDNNVGLPLTTPSATTVTIVENDVAQRGSLQFAPATYSVSEGGGSVALNVARVSGSDGTATVEYTVIGGTATSGSDYGTATGTLSWAAGDAATKSFSIPIVSDTTFEANETIVLRLQNPGGAALGAPIDATVTIVNDDAEPPGQVVANQTVQTATEGFHTSITLELNRVNGTGGSVTATVAFSGTATLGSDYTVASTTATFAPGENRAFINVTLLDDALVESAETIVMTVQSVTGGATIGSPSQNTVTISDNDFPAGQLSFDPNGYSVNENQGTVTLTVRRTQGSAGAITVNYATSSPVSCICYAPATAGSDYVPASGTLSWGNGDTTARTITLSIVNDTVDEWNNFDIIQHEDFNVILSGPTGGAAVVYPDVAAIAIFDDDDTGI
jgi:hypothetical protein